MFTAKLTGNVAIFDLRCKIHIQLLTTVTQNRKINNKSWHSSDSNISETVAWIFPESQDEDPLFKKKKFLFKEIITISSSAEITVLVIV